MDSQQLQQLLDAQLAIQQARAAGLEAEEASTAAAPRAFSAPDPPSSSPQRDLRYHQQEPRAAPDPSTTSRPLAASSAAPGMSSFHSRSATAAAAPSLFATSLGAASSSASQQLTDYALLQALQHSGLANSNESARLLLQASASASASSSLPAENNAASLQALLLQMLNPPPPPTPSTTTSADVHQMLLLSLARQNNEQHQQQQQRQASNSVLETLRLRAALLGRSGSGSGLPPSRYALESLLHGQQQQQQQQLLPQANTVNNNSSANDHLVSLLVEALVQQQQGQAAAPAAAATRADHPDPPTAAAATVPSPRVSAAATTTTAAAAVKEIEISEEEEARMLIPDLPEVRPLPPLEEGNTEHFSKRSGFVPLATDEDSNWLSERQVFIRADLLEVVRASHQDVLARSSSKGVAYQQVGIRCRFCAHLHPSARAMRSSAYPSSIRQMYQSFTMMVRDHWAGCKSLPPKLRQRFLAYQEHKIPSSSLSREYWAYAARKIGMVDAEFGITITEDSMQAANKMLSFGTKPEHVQAMELQGKEQDEQHEALISSSDQKPKAKETPQKEGKEQKELLQLLHPRDKTTLSPYLFLLMKQVTPCYLLESEQVGKRKSAPVGLSGFGCKHCILKGRLGFCRVFPLNKRSMPTKVNDVYSHIQRCSLTPPETRTLLRKYKREALEKAAAAGRGSAAAQSIGDIKGPGRLPERDREFVDQIWTKLGRTGFQI